MSTTAAPKASTTGTVPSSDQESMTPAFSWEWDSFPEYNGNHDNRELYPDEDWWNSELLLHPQQYDPFLLPVASTITAATSTDIIQRNNINNDNEKKSVPLRITRRPPKLRLSLPTFSKTTTSTLRIQDVLERLDLDQTAIGVNNERSQPSPSCNRASPNDKNTLDSDFYYFWNTKSPCQWQHHNNHKRQRCHPPRPPMVLEEIGHATAVPSTFVTIEGFGADWTIFSCEDETLDRNHDGSIVPFISHPNNIEWSLQEVKVPAHSPTNSTNCQSILLEGSSLDGTTISALSFATPTQNNPKRKCRRARSKSLDLPSSSSTSMDHYSTTAHHKDSNAYTAERNDNAETLSALLVSTVNKHGNAHSTISNNCPDEVDDANVDNDDAKSNLKQSAVARISTANDNDDINNGVWQLLRQNGTMQENDLLRRNNRQVLHRLAYAQLMGMHITH